MHRLLGFVEIIATHCIIVLELQDYIVRGLICKSTEPAFACRKSNNDLLINHGEKIKDLFL